MEQNHQHHDFSPGGRQNESGNEHTQWSGRYGRGTLACLLMFAMLLISGCAAGNHRVQVELPADIPSQWASDAAADELPITGGLLALIDDDSLKQLVGEAMVNNPNLSATAARLKASEHLVFGVRAQQLPKLSAGYAAKRNNQSVNALGEGITENTHTLSLGFSWEMDLWGRLADDTAAAGRTVLAQREDYLLARDVLAARVIQAWIDQVSIRRSIEIETERIEVIQRIETVLMERFKDGIGSLDELSAARSRTEIARADLSARETGLMQSIRKMEVLLGRYPEGKLNTGTELPHVASPRAGIPATALLNRPDVRAAMARLAVARHTAGAAEKARLPSLSLTGEVFKESARLGDIGGAETYWGILGSLFQPLFEGGRLKHEAMARQIEAEAKLLALRDVILAAAGEVETVLDALRGIDAQARAIDAALTESEISSRYFEERYRQGLDAIQTLLLAKEQEMALKERQSELSAEKLKNRIDLALALGVGVVDDVNLSEGETE